jgi:hypothetical protein
MRKAWKEKDLNERERVRKQQPAAVSEILSAKLKPAPPALGLRAATKRRKPARRVCGGCAVAGGWVGRQRMGR